MENVFSEFSGHAFVPGLEPSSWEIFVAYLATLPLSTAIFPISALLMLLIVLSQTLQPVSCVRTRSTTGRKAHRTDTWEPPGYIQDIEQLSLREIRRRTGSARRVKS